MSEFSDFEIKFNAAIGATLDDIDKRIRAGSLELFTAIVMGTPVGDPDLWQNKAPAGYVGGTLRGNWQIGIDREPAGTIDTTDEDGGSTVAAGNGQLAGFSLDRNSDIYISNNLPYAERVEYGWSSQAPQGMVRINVRAFKEMMER